MDILLAPSDLFKSISKSFLFFFSFFGRSLKEREIKLNRLPIRRRWIIHGYAIYKGYKYYLIPRSLPKDRTGNKRKSSAMSSLGKCILFYEMYTHPILTSSHPSIRLLKNGFLLVGTIASHRFYRYARLITFFGEARGHRFLFLRKKCNRKLWDGLEKGARREGERSRGIRLVPSFFFVLRRWICVLSISHSFRHLLYSSELTEIDLFFFTFFGYS